MKRTAAAVSKELGVSRQRARVRALIELNGWHAPLVLTTIQSGLGESPNNVIPFPSQDISPKVS